MDLLTNTSILVAFIAGVAALFAPCCITVLLPSYLGSVFKEKYKVVLMTFVFFLGILSVFLPIGLGAAALAQFFNAYHSTIFTLGGLMLAALGLSLVLGKTFSIPSPVSPRVKGGGVLSIFLLGVFSAIATTCCAPVLAGVLALSVASGSVFWGGVYTLSYVLGMTLPLFLVAAFLDRIDFAQKFSFLQEPRSITVFGYRYRFILTELVVGVVFLGMGLYIVYLALTDQLFMQSGYQLSVNLFVERLARGAEAATAAVPDVAWAAIVLAIIGIISAYAVKQFKHYEK